MVAVMNKEVTAVCNFLKTKSINIPMNNEWLTACVECFVEQGNYSINELSNLVYQQWLLADLADIGVQVIPHHCLSADKFILEGRYAVQLNYFVNIATPFHKQLHRIRKPEALQNLEIEFEGVSAEQQTKDEPKGCRILKVELTDGVNTLIGFEDQFIPSLNEPFVPGKKVVLVGPIECRKRILFLKPNNIIVLGGEVDALHIPNATENLLARKLKLPENPDPYSQQLSLELIDNDSTLSVRNVCSDEDDEAMMMLAEVIEREVPEAPSSMVQGVVRNPIVQTRVNFVNHRIDRDHVPLTKPTLHGILPNLNNCISQQNPLGTTPNLQSKAKRESVFSVSRQTKDIDFDDDFDLLAEQTTVAAEQKQRISTSTSVDKIAAELKTYEMFDSAPAQKDFKEITELKQKLNESYCNNDKPRDQIKSTSSINSISDSLKYREDGKILVDYLNDKISALVQLPQEPESSQATFDSQSTQSEENSLIIQPFPPRKRPAIVCTHAQVVKVLKKPKLKDEKWSVSALVEAKGVELEVTFESHVIDKIFMISAAEIVSKRAELASNPVLKERINSTLRQSQLKFSKLACEMTFHFRDAISDPLIIDVKND